MRIDLVVPGLVWPNPGVSSLTAGLALPALERLLGLGRVVQHGRMPIDTWLGKAFTLPAARLPLGAMRRMGEPLLPAPAAGIHYLCADPVNLHFAREHLLLSALPEHELTAAEADALVDSLNAFFMPLDDGIAGFEIATPERWYLKLTKAPQTRFFALDDVIGRPVSHFMPEGADSRDWQRLGNEVQVLLHNHPVNQARETAGRRPVNSVWLWGDGDPLPAPGRAPAQLVSNDLLARGLARSLGVATSKAAGLPDGDTVVMADELLRPSLFLDLGTWRDELQRLEQTWFAPLLAALKTRRVTQLNIVAPGDRASLEITLRPTDCLKFWRTAHTLESLLPKPLQ
ncbi:MAG TPA: hypothetical protein PLR02_09730 [Rhodocyclaceae bacterium]|nr:hypothetical protein [Rhodocyclaceae bacterium]